MPPQTVIAGLAAASLLELWLPALDARPIEMITRGDPLRARDIGHSRRPEVRARRRAIRDDEVVIVNGLPITTAARTWCDLAEWLPPADLVAAGDSALRGQASMGDLQAAVTRATGRRGVQRARAILPFLDRRSVSRPESHLRYALVGAGLPHPEVNEPVYVDDQWIGVPDLHYRSARLALEYQGKDHADVRRMRADITRRLDFDWVGWTVLTFGPRQVFGRPDQVASLVRRTLLVRDPGCLSARDVRDVPAP